MIIKGNHTSLLESIYHADIVVGTHVQDTYIFQCSNNFRNEAKLCPDVVVADIQDDQGERQVELQQTEDQVLI